jgi:hypothetical protein
MAESGGWRRRLGTASLVVLAVGVGGAAQAYKPDPIEQQGPFIRTGHLGDRVDARTFDARLLGVRGGALIKSRGLDHDTSGVWIVVKVRLTSHGEPVQLGQVSIRDGDGRTFRASARIDNNPPLRQLQPGLTVDCEIAFEVPKDVPLPVAARLTTALIDVRMDGMAQLELDVTAAQLQQWAADKTPLVVMRPVLADADSAGATPSASAAPGASPTLTGSATPKPSATPKASATPKTSTTPKATKTPKSTPSAGGN